MRTNKILSLVGVPWPMSILRCNRALRQMGAGDRLAVNMSDPHVVENIRMMLHNLEEYRSSIHRSEAVWTILVDRKRSS